jgi:hypothetical protein
MYCDTERENTHIAGEERALLLVAIYRVNTKILLDFK